MEPMPQPGDILVFDGSDWSDIVKIAGHVLSNGIEVWTASNLSHSAMVYKDPKILIESTILDGKSGPQLHPINGRIETYNGRMWLLVLADKVRASLDFDAMWKLADAKLAGGDTYNVGEIGAYLARKVPILSWLPWFYKENPHSEVCSELCAELLRAGGMAGLKPPEICPQTLAEMRIYAQSVQIKGQPSIIKNFNTV